MGIQKIYSEEGHLHFLTIRSNNGLPILEKDICAQAIIENLNFYRKKYNIKIVGYVIMPNHLHLLVGFNNNGQDKRITDFIRDFKKGVAMQIIRALKTQGNEITLKNLARKKVGRGNYQYSVWQRKYFDFNIFSRQKLVEKLEYIHNNPVAKRLAETPTQWKYSSYRNYYSGDNSVLMIDKI